MSFLDKKERIKIRKFIKKGYLINRSENKRSLKYIINLIKKTSSKLLGVKKIDLNYIHKLVNINDLNEFRLSIIKNINKDKNIRYHYFSIGKNNLYDLAGNELMMQKNLNLSIQFPNDETSLLPIHSDVWSGDSAFEINLWLPLVNCYRTKSMYILRNEKYEIFMKKIKNLGSKSSQKIYESAKEHLKWIKIDYGNYLLFNQAIPHGNVVNKEKQTRWSMNCRFKSFFSPYEDKKIGEFFLPITSRAMTEIGTNYKDPFK
jgi:sporadic carbohydrate cluster 2OG-Fe(II) oxygenase